MSHNRQDTYAALTHLVGGPSISGFVDFAFSDSADIDYRALGVNLEPRAFAVFTTGDLKITTMLGKTDLYANGELNKGQFYPEAIKRIWSTGTTATLVRIYF